MKLLNERRRKILGVVDERGDSQVVPTRHLQGLVEVHGLALPALVVPGKKALLRDSVYPGFASRQGAEFDKSGREAAALARLI